MQFNLIILAIDISQVPQRIADMLGLPLLAGQMLISIIFMCLIMFPALLLTNKWSSQSLAALITGIGAMGFLIAAGWLPYWFLLIICLIVALMYASKMRDFLGGK